MTDIGRGKAIKNNQFIYNTGWPRKGGKKTMCSPGIDSIVIKQNFSNLLKWSIF